MSLRGGGSQRRADAFAAALDGSGPSDATTTRLTVVAAAIASLPLATVATPEAARSAGRAALLAAAGVEAARHAGATAASAHAVSSAAGTTGSTAGSALSTAAASAGAPATTAATATAVTAAAGIAHVALPVVSGLVAAAVAVSGVAVAAHRSLPGQPFYMVKTAAESVRLDLAGSPSAKAHDRLSFAAARLSEIRALSHQPQTPLVIARTKVLLAQFDADIKAASGPLLAAGGASAQALWNAVTAASTELQSFSAQLPAALQADTTQALSLLTVSALLVKAVLPNLPTVPIPPGVPDPITGLLNSLLHPSPAATTTPGSGPTSVPTGSGTPQPSSSPSPTAPSEPTSRPTSGPSGGPTGGPTGSPTVEPTMPPTAPTSSSILPPLPTILPTLPTSLPTSGLPIPLVSQILSGLDLPLTSP